MAESSGFNIKEWVNGRRAWKVELQAWAVTQYFLDLPKEKISAWISISVLTFISETLRVFMIYYKDIKLHTVFGSDSFELFKNSYISWLFFFRKKKCSNLL
jgi:hypothetical protein